MSRTAEDTANYRTSAEVINNWLETADSNESKITLLEFAAEVIKNEWAAFSHGRIILEHTDNGAGTQTACLPLKCLDEHGNDINYRSGKETQIDFAKTPVAVSDMECREICFCAYRRENKRVYLLEKVLHRLYSRNKRRHGDTRTSPRSSRRVLQNRQGTCFNGIFSCALSAHQKRRLPLDKRPYKQTGGSNYGLAVCASLLHEAADMAHCKRGFRQQA